MKKIILGMVLGLTALSAHANDEDPGTRYTTRYSCSFTEPFLDVNYDSYSKTLSVVNSGVHMKTLKDVSVKGDDKSTDVNIVDKSGSTVLTLRNELGNNGMSDEVFMMTGIYEGHVGGCNFSFKKIAD
jgi:hypothetical protein